MPTTQRKLAGSVRTFDARPDRLDIRDREYRPSLRNLPSEFPSREFIAKWFHHYEPLVMDQGEDGACTGFGLAAMINYLRFQEEVKKAEKEKRAKISTDKLMVSPAMLYRLARLYDEWPGENYTGSSCRGAMKGWHKHGVCLAETWRYEAGKLLAPDPRWRVESAEVVLGAYYRIDIKSITDIQAAILEVGAVYVSTEVHSGWGQKSVTKFRERLGDSVFRLPDIAYKPGNPADDVHALAIVGYDREGFIVQNSWGKDWGWHGFARLLYEDWLAHGLDAWVAALGVPVNPNAVPDVTSGVSLTERAASFRKAGASVGESSVFPYRRTISLGNNGVPLNHFVDHDSEGMDGAGAVKRVMADITAALTTLEKPKLVIYGHGGLNSQEASFNRVKVLGPIFEGNDVVPLFLTWHTGFKETLSNMGVDLVSSWKQKIGDLFGLGRAGAGEGGEDKQHEVLDRTFEVTFRVLLKAGWNEMKENAAGGAKPGGGLYLLMQSLIELKAKLPKLQVHLVGHSAGSIILGHLLTLLNAYQVPVSSCHLFAAACTVGFARERYQPAIYSGILPARKFINYTLSSENERRDVVGTDKLTVYFKSLLYLVSRGCEDHKTPLLGMASAWNDDDPKDEGIWNEDLKARDVKPWRDFVKGQAIEVPRLIATPTVTDADDGNGNVRKEPASHGSFDNNIEVMTATLRAILGSPLKNKISDLTGF